MSQKPALDPAPGASPACPPARGQEGPAGRPARPTRSGGLVLGGRTLSLAGPPLVMGVLNVTPDSFSDGGSFVDPGLAEERALRIQEEGAAILDIGGESSRPGARPISAGEEIRRLLPVLRRVLPKLKIPVSVDTYKSEVAEMVLDHGASMINDIYALRFDSKMPSLIKRYRAGVVLMHLRGSPETMQSDTLYMDVAAEVEGALAAACRTALDAGIPADRIVVDPGIGFGKSAEGNCALLREIGPMKRRLGFPMLVGLSRKSFIRRILGPGGAPEDLRSHNAALHALAVLWGADILRAHDVRETVETARLASTAMPPSPRGARLPDGQVPRQGRRGLASAWPTSAVRGVPRQGRRGLAAAVREAR